MFLMTPELAFSTNHYQDTFRIKEMSICVCKVILSGDNNMFDLQITVFHKNTIERLSRHCMHRLFPLLSPPFTSTHLLSFQHSDKKTTKVSPSCLGG